MVVTEFLKWDLQMIETEDWDKVQEIVEYTVHTSLKIQQSSI